MIYPRIMRQGDTTHNSVQRLEQIQRQLSSSPTMSVLPDNENAIFFGRECVNRVSFLRDDSDFITLAAKHPSTKYAVLNKGVIYGYNKGESGPAVWYATYEDLKGVIDTWCQQNASGEGVPLAGIKATFLGLDESESGIVYRERYSGVAYFGIEVGCDDKVVSLLSEKQNLKLYDNRNIIFKLENFDASIYSHAKMYLDWMDRNRFCAGCGKHNVVVHGGTKLLCSSDKEADKCPVKNASVSNVSFPRTDCVVITAVSSRNHDKMLLARGKRFPGPMFSCVAGFMEPSETVEAASLREVWEETGVKGKVCDIVQTQPWPYPANMMIGCVVYVDFNGINEVIDLGHDPELADAKWVDIQEVKRILEGGKADWFIPPATAIAHSLIKHCVDKYEAGETRA